MNGEREDGGPIDTEFFTEVVRLRLGSLLARDDGGVREREIRRENKKLGEEVKLNLDGGVYSFVRGTP